MNNKNILLTSVFILAVLAGCQGFPNGDPTEFFTGYEYQQLVEMLVSLVFGFILAINPKFNLFQWIKNLLNVKDQAAHYLVMGVAILITFLAMLVTDAVNFDVALTLENLISLASFVYVGSQIAYKRLKAGGKIE